MTLRLLKSLAPIANAVRMLGAESLTPRPSGRRWQATRARLQLAQGSVCRRCGRLWIPERDQVDHRVPREAGGGDGDENLDLLCDECHAVKTAGEAHARGRRS